MDVREKLVELICDGTQKTEICTTDTHMDCETCRGDCGYCTILADHLIANGVTVQECGHWVSLTDCSNAGVYCSVCNKKVYKEDYAWCNRKNKLRSNYCPNCGAKMMPQPPEGE